MLKCCNSGAARLKAAMEGNVKPLNTPDCSMHGLTPTVKLVLHTYKLMGQWEAQRVSAEGCDVNHACGAELHT